LISGVREFTAPARRARQKTLVSVGSEAAQFNDFQQVSRDLANR